MSELIEYRVRPVTRYIVTRFHREEDGSSAAPTVMGRGEFDNPDTAWDVGYALARAEHERLGWPLGDVRIKYPQHPRFEEAAALPRTALTAGSTAAA